MPGRPGLLRPSWTENTGHDHAAARHTTRSNKHPGVRARGSEAWQARRTMDFAPLHPTVAGLLTLFSKCFASFARATCSLSVSRRYLALPETYLALDSALSNRATLGTTTTWTRDGGGTGLPPSRARHSGRLSHRPASGLRSAYYNSSLAAGFRLGLFPVHSPLLGESQLLSFPGLSDMLKLSPFSCTAEVERGGWRPTCYPARRKVDPFGRHRRKNPRRSLPCRASQVRSYPNTASGVGEQESAPRSLGPLPPTRGERGTLRFRTRKSGLCADVPRHLRRKNRGV
jgi:hypothetical protein